MNTEPELDNRSLDDELAEFTDRVLLKDSEEAPEISTQHSQLRSLEEIVIALKRLLPSNEPDPETARRIHTHLKEEWQRSKAQAQRTHPWRQKAARYPLHWLKRLPHLSRERKFALSFVLLAVILVAVVWLLAPGLDANLTATAGGQTNLLPLILILVILGIAALFALFRSRR